MGDPGMSPDIRELPGGSDAAQKLFDDLARGGTDVTPPNYPGKMVEFPDGSRVGIRPVSGSGNAAIDVNVPGVGVTKIHFP